MAADLSDAQWEVIIAKKVKEVLERVSEKQGPAEGAVLASVTSPSDPRFPLAIDHYTLLKQDATPAQIDALCDEAIEHGFKGTWADLADNERQETVRDRGVKVKASGGVRSFEACREMFEAGAERIGTSSGVSLMKNAAAGAGAY